MLYSETKEMIGGYRIYYRHRHRDRLMLIDIESLYVVITPTLLIALITVINLLM